MQQIVHTVMLSLKPSLCITIDQIPNIINIKIRCRNWDHDDRDDEQKIGRYCFLGNKTKRGVTTIVYYGKNWKTKDKTMIYEIRLGFGSQLCVEKVLASYNVRPKTIPLIR